MNFILDSMYIGETSLEICHGDLTEQEVDAIVNPANAYLQHGGGVAGAIVRRGGQSIQQESEAWIREHGRVAYSLPAFTNPGTLPCKIIIHAVGPIWGEGDEDRKLSEAVCGSLNLADRKEYSSIAFPAISTGIYGFPKERAAQIILDTQMKWLRRHPLTCLNLVRNVLLDDATVAIFLKEFLKHKS